MSFRPKSIFRDQAIARLTSKVTFVIGLAAFALWNALQLTLPFLTTDENSLPGDSYLQNVSIAIPDHQPELKTILFWTTWHGMNLAFGFGRQMGNSLFKDCPVSNCNATRDRSLLNQSHAVMIHTWMVDMKSSDLPVHQNPRQRFVMYYSDPPVFLPQHVLNSIPAHFFNWTFNYRRIADIHNNQFGDLRFIPHSVDRKLQGTYEDEESLDNFYGVNITGKSIMVAWFSSNLRPNGIAREDYVSELRKYVRVDIYGKRGNLSCAAKFNYESDDCDELLRRDYLFYLSFENTLCPEYVTEKLFRPLRAGAVPVVLGGAHYSQFAPPGSYIKALDFESPKQLADHLIQLERNRKLYAHYFEWRKYFQVETRPADSWCQLCAMLNDNSLPPKSYENISKWWYDNYPCNNIEFKFN